MSLKITWVLFFGLAIHFSNAQNNNNQKESKELNQTTDVLTFHTNWPIIKLTKGPKQHWFGYYDKWQVDPTGRYLLGCEVDNFLKSKFY